MTGPTLLRIRRSATGRAVQRLLLRARLLLVLLLAVVLLAGAAEPSTALEVRAWVDKTEATLEDQIFLTVSVSGARRLPGEPVLPPLPEFSVTKGGTSSRTEIVNGTIRTSAEVTYLLAPRRVGTYTIGPVRIESKGHTFESQPLVVKILPADSSAESRPMAFVTQHVDVVSPFVRQQIVYTFRFFRRVQSVEAQWEPPSFQGFWVEDLGKERQYEKIIGGQRYAVTELKKALYPLSEGSGKIEETRLACKLVIERTRSPRSGDSFLDNSFLGGSFFGRQTQTITKNLRADPILLDIRPLPEAGRPDGFEGLVGSFAVRAEVGQTELRAGDSTTLTVTVTGDGNLRDLVALSPEEIPGFKVYPDKPSFQLEIQGERLLGTKVFKKALVPLEDGILEIPSQEIPYFDPGTGSYRIARTDPFTLKIEKNGEKEPLHLVTADALPGSKSSIKIIGHDILPIHTGLAGAQEQIPLGTSLYAMLGGLLMPPLVFVVCYSRKRREERLEIDQHILRRKGARKQADRLLKEARKRTRQPEDQEFFRLLARSLKGLIGDKLDLTTLAYTPTEIEVCLTKKGFREEEVRELRRFLEQIEYDQYVSKRLEANEREARYRQAKKILARLDRRF